MSVQANPYPLRIEKETLEKAKIIAKDSGRSLNKEIEFLLKKHISQYEKENGVIQVNLDLYKDVDL